MKKKKKKKIFIDKKRKDEKDLLRGGFSHIQNELPVNGQPITITSKKKRYPKSKDTTRCTIYV